MFQLWSAVFIAIVGMDIGYFACSAPARVLNMNWKCTEGAPCLSIVRPRGGLAVVGSAVDSFKLEVMVHRVEGEKERILEKWSATRTSTTIWNVEVTWFRLVEKGVRIPMQQCRNKLICVASLLDVESMTHADDDVFGGQVISHHFEVSVSYQGHKQTSNEEIIIERQISENAIGTQSEKAGGDQAASHRSTSSFTRIESPMGQYMESKYSDVDDYTEKKKKEKNDALLKSGLYSNADEDHADEVYEANDTGEPPKARVADASDVKKLNDSENIAQNAPDLGDIGAVALLSNTTLNMTNLTTTEFRIQDINGTLLTIVSGNRTMNESHPWHHQTDDFITDLFLRLGPTATVIILLIAAILMAFSCVCCYNRIGRMSRARAMYHYEKMDKAKQPLNLEPFPEQQVFTESRKPKRKESRGLHGVFNSISSLMKLRKQKKRAPKLSAGKRRVSSDETSAELEGESLEDEETSLLDDDEDEEDSDDSEDDDDSDDEGKGGVQEFGRKIKEKGSQIFSKVKDAAAKNETFQKFKNNAKENPLFVGTKNAALNLSEGKNAFGDRWSRPGENQGLMKKFCSALSKLFCPCFYLLRDCCDCLCGCCCCNQFERQQKRAQKRMFDFMPSRGPRRSSDEEDEEVDVLYTKSDRKEASMPSATKSDSTKSPNKSVSFTPQTDISGRFYPNQTVKILRDSYGNSNRRDGCNVLYPSSRAANFRNKEPQRTVPIVDSVVNVSPSQNDNEGCSCHLNAGDTGSSSSPLCRNESLHSPRKQRCGLHCIQQRSPLHHSRQISSPSPRPLSQRMPVCSSRPPLPPRISRTPPPNVQPPSSSSSSELVGSRPYENVTSSTSQTSSSSEDHQNDKKHALGRGDASTPNKTALQKTKEFFRRENEHMDALLQSWEELSRGNSTNERGRRRSRVWLANRRNRRRELSLQQEARLANSKSTAATPEASSSGTRASEPVTSGTAASRTTCPPTRLVTGTRRLNMPNMEETLRQTDKQSLNKAQFRENQTSKESTARKIFLPKRSELADNALEKENSRTSESDETLESTSAKDSSSLSSDENTFSTDVTSFQNDGIRPTSSTIAASESKQDNNVPRYSVVKKSKISESATKTDAPSPSSEPQPSGNKTRSSDGKYEFISASNSPRKPGAEVHAKKLSQKDNFKKHPPDRPNHVQISSPRNTLNSAALAFFREEEYESLSSDDEDEDDFWRVSL